MCVLNRIRDQKSLYIRFPAWYETNEVYGSYLAKKKRILYQLEIRNFYIRIPACYEVDINFTD